MLRIELLKQSLSFYAISDRTWVGSQTLLEQIEDSFKGGVSFFQLREKSLPKQEFLKEATEIKKLCSLYNVPFIINDNVEVAQEVDADGVHLGQSDMDAGIARKILGANKIIGVSVKTLEQAIRAQNNGANYLGIGAAFGSLTKSDTKKIDHSVIKEICEIASIPVVAVGGINLQNIDKLKGLGLSGFAIVSGIYSSENIINSSLAFKQKIKEITE